MNLIEFLRLLKGQHIIGVVGDLGDGKSITGVSIIKMIRTLSLLTNQPMNVASNIPLAYPHKFLEYYDDLEGLSNCLIFIDEIHLIADSRTGMGKSNFFTVGVTMAVRKTMSQMFWTSQETSQVELRVRNRTSLYLNPVKISPYPEDLRFDISVISKQRRLMGNIILNLDPFKNDYDTHYIPLTLKTDDEED